MSTRVSTPTSRSEITLAANLHCEGVMLGDTSLITFLKALQSINDEGEVGRGLKGNFAKNARLRLLADSNAGKSFLSCGSTTGEGGRVGETVSLRTTPVRSLGLLRTALKQKKTFKP